jgi:hypothetical protein
MQWSEMPRWVIQASWLYVLSACGANRAHAEELDLECAITVEGEASNCVTARSLRERIATYLPAHARSQALSIAVRIEGESAGFRVLRGAEVIAERRFARLPVICAERRDTIAVAVAVAIENALPPPAARGETSAPPASQPANDARAPASSQAANASSAPAGSPGSLAAPPQPLAAVVNSASVAPAVREADEPEAERDDASQEPDSGAPTKRPTAQWMLFGGVAYVAQLATTPLAAFQLGAEFAPIPVFRVHVSGFATPESSERFAGGDVTSRAAGGHALACLNSPIFAMIAQGCAGASAGLVHASGRGFDREFDDDMGWLAGHGRATFEIPASGPVAARVALDAWLNLVRPELRVRRSGTEDASQSTDLLGGSIGGEIILRLD